MADLSPYINVNAVFDTAARTLTLNDTGTYPAGVPLSYGVSATTPGGGVLVAATMPVVMALPSATDGLFQQGAYQVAVAVSRPGDSGTQTRNAVVNLAPVQVSTTLAALYATPSFVYTDATAYGQAGYGVPALVRSWAVMRTGSQATVAGSGITFNLAVGGVYYRSQYGVALTTTATYLSTANLWLTVVVHYSSSVTFQPYLFPPKADLLSWLIPTGCDCEDDSEPAGFYKAAIDFFCSGDYASAWIYVQRLYKATHSRTRFMAAYNGQALGSVQYCVGVVTHVRIITQPLAGPVGVPLTTAATAGTLPYTYQWYNLAGAIAGATSPIYTPTVADTYHVMVTDATGGNDTSADAIVSALPALAITQQPQSQTATAGATATFSVVVTGGVPNYTYQWQISTDGGNTWIDIGSGVQSTFTTGVLNTSSNNNRYRCIVGDQAGGSITSAAATLTVQAAGLQAPTLSAQRSANSIRTYFNNPTGGDRIHLQFDGFSNFQFAVNQTVSYPQTTLDSSFGNALGNTYYYRARTEDAQGIFSPWSATLAVTLFDTILSVGGTQSGVDDVSLAGAAGLELHYNRINLPVSPNSSEDHFIIGGTDRGNASYQDDHNGQDIAVVFGGLVRYGPNTTTQYKFTQGQPANINIS